MSYRRSSLIQVPPKPDYKDVGSYDAATLSYTLERLPLPPQGRVTRHETPGGDFHETVDVALACPHCKQDVEMRYSTQTVARSLAQEVYRDGSAKLDRERQSLIELSGAMRELYMVPKDETKVLALYQASLEDFES